MENSLNINHIEQLIILIKKYKDNNINTEELSELNTWLDANETNRQIFNRMLNDNQIGDDLLAFEKVSLENHTKRILRNTGKIKSLKTIYYRIAAAAVILVVFGTFLHFYTNNQSKHSQTITKNTGDIMPASNDAVLTLANGSKIILDSAHNGKIAVQGNVKIIKQNGQIAYINARTGKPISGENTMTTPNGRQFQLTLPDNSKVWLNAASSIKYPIAFSGTERKVEVSGEAYFEVAKNADMPFIVKINNDAQVKVLGTHFNINAYEKKIKTTLLEGSVQFSGNKNSVKLFPGQQGQMNASQNINVISDEDLDEVMAWRNNKFIFNDASIEDIMNNVARWYDVQIDYKTNIHDRYTINVSNSLPLSQLLKFIEQSGGVHFELNGKNVIVKI